MVPAGTPADLTMSHLNDSYNFDRYLPEIHLVLMLCKNRDMHTLYYMKIFIIWVIYKYDSRTPPGDFFGWSFTTKCCIRSTSIIHFNIIFASTTSGAWERFSMRESENWNFGEISSLTPPVVDVVITLEPIINNHSLQRLVKEFYPKNHQVAS